MPPHCDTMDGPVVNVAKKALETGNVKLILPWAPQSTEAEITKAFEMTQKVRQLGTDAQTLADQWFFETVVRLHRAGEGEPFTGLKPAGLDEGPVVPKAERAIEQGNPDEVIHFLQHAVAEELRERFAQALKKKRYDEHNVRAAREYVEAMLTFILYSHKLYQFIKKGNIHGESGNAPGHHEH